MFNTQQYAMRALEEKYGITAVGRARVELLRDEFTHVRTARCGSGTGCRSLRLLGWTPNEFDVLWTFDSNAETAYATHYGNVIS